MSENPSNATHEEKNTGKRSHEEMEEDGMEEFLVLFDPTSHGQNGLSCGKIKAAQEQCNTRSNAVGVPAKRWTEKAIEKVLSSQTDPVGKFLRDLNITSSDAARLNIMPHLDEAPRKPRTGYGKRKDLSPQDRKALSRERNKEHARSTRQRRKVFEKVLDQQLRKLGLYICNAFCQENTGKYLQRRSRRVENLVAFFLLMDSNVSSDTPLAWQYSVCPEVTTTIQLQWSFRQERSNASSTNNPFHTSGEDGIMMTSPATEIPILSLSFTGDYSTLSRPLSYFDLPLSLMKLPDTADQTLQYSLPVTKRYEGFKSLQEAMKYLLQNVRSTILRNIHSDAYFCGILGLAANTAKNESTSDLQSKSRLASKTVHVTNVSSIYDVNPHGCSEETTPGKYFAGQDVNDSSCTTSAETPLQESVLPAGMKLLISFSKNDLLVQGNKAMCSLDSELVMKRPFHSIAEDIVGSDCRTDTSPEVMRNSTTRPPTSSNSVVLDIPGAMACFSFDKDVASGSKIREVWIDYDVDAAAIKYLECLHDAITTHRKQSLPVTHMKEV